MKSKQTQVAIKVDITTLPLFQGFSGDDDISTPDFLSQVNSMNELLYPSRSNLPFLTLTDSISFVDKAGFSLHLAGTSLIDNF